MKREFGYLLACICVTAVISCSPAGGSKRGHEFMPDMVHSTAYEANLYNYYYYNTWGSEEEYKKFAMPRHSVPGTVPRGSVAAALGSTPEERMLAYGMFTGTSSHHGIAMAPNGAVPYPYGDTEEERVRASREITANPFPITTAGLERGKQLYTIYCGICHGEKGDGLGYLVREEDPARGITAGVYPAAPANLMKEDFIDTTAGMFYHSIVYGKNMMGSYADKLSYEERWQVIHYIRSLQAKVRGVPYDENANGLTADVPGAPILAKIRQVEAMAKKDQMTPPAETQNHQGEH